MKKRLFGGVDKDKVDSVDVREQMRVLEENLKTIKQVQALVEKMHGSCIRNIEDSRNVAGIFSEFGKVAINNDPEAAKLGGLIEELTGFIRQHDDIKSDMNQWVVRAFAEYYDEFAKDSKDCDLKFKNWEKPTECKVRGSCDSAQKSLKKLGTNKKTPKEKLVEAEAEVEKLSKQFEADSESTTNMLLERNNILYDTTLEKMHEYAERYYNSYKQGFEGATLLHNAIKKFYHKQAEGSSEEENEEEESTPLGAKRNVLNEVIVLERNYVANLNSIYHTYKQKLEANPALKLSSKEIKDVFSTVGDILKIHDGLCTRLEKLFEETADPSTTSVMVGKIFVEVIPDFKVYNDYVNNISNALDTLSLLEENRSVSKFLKELKKNDKYGGLPLRKLLTIPVKHIQQYGPLIQKLFDKTLVNDPDFPPIEDSLESIQTIITMVQAGSDSSTNYQNLLLASRKVEGYPGSMEPILNPGRQYIREGKLILVTAREKKGKEAKSKRDTLYFFLFNDLFLMSTIPAIGSNVSYKDSVPVHKLKIENVEDSDEMLNAFKLHYGEDEFWTLAATSSNEKQQWLQDIDKAIRQTGNIKAFGVNLIDLMNKNEHEFGRAIPHVLEDAVEILSTKEALTHEGLFRLSGSQQNIAEVKDAANLGNLVDLSALSNLNDVAGLLKLWLRELSDPLLTYALYDKWIAVYHEENEETKIKTMRNLVKKLPQHHRFTLNFLLAFLKTVAEHGEVNKMKASNLAIVFGPNILSKKDANPFDCADHKAMYACVEALIADYHAIFDPLEVDKEIKAYRKSIQSANAEKIAELEAKQKAEKEKRNAAKRERDVAKYGDKEKEAREKAEAERAAQEEKERREREEVEAKERAEREEKERIERKAAEKRKKEEDRERRHKEKEKEKQERKEKERADRLEEEKRKREKDEADDKIRKEKLAEINAKEKAEREKYAAEMEAEKKRVEEENKKRHEDAQRDLEEQKRKLAEAEKEEDERIEKERLARLPKCSKCQLAIEGGKGMKALGKPWHKACFVCTECSTLLEDFEEKDGAPYCPQHYADKFGDKCGICSKGVVPPAVGALGKKFHKACFKCTQCSASLAGGFFPKDGLPICEECANK